MNLLEAIFLGIVQALTEWLPISSSGHLVLIQQVLKLNPPLIFNAMLHLGTIIVTILVFFKDIVKIVERFVKLDFKSQDGRLGPLILVGIIPTGVIGLGFRFFIEPLFYNLFAVAIGFVISGFILFSTKQKTKGKGLSLWDSILIGIAQGIAIAPGISRSGATIGAGLIRGVKKEVAVKYAFLISIPAILGATVVEMGGLVWDIDLLAGLVGMSVSMTVGFLSFKALLRIVKHGNLYKFAYYCWIAGIASLIISVL